MNKHTTEIVKQGLQKRYNAERRFRAYGMFAILISVSFLAVLLTSVIGNSVPAFQESVIELEVDLSQDNLGLSANPTAEELFNGSYENAVKAASYALFDISGRKEKRAIRDLISSGAWYSVRDAVVADPSLLGKPQKLWVLASDNADLYMKGIVTSDMPETARRLSDQQVQWLDELISSNRIQKQFAYTFFTSGDSREPETAGILAALKGSLYTLLVTILLSAPIGVMAAIYLEEFAPKNRLTDIIEVNINNLAAVPSIVFGLLGLAVFLNFFEMPRSAPVVGGVVLSLMTLPTVIIASRAAIKAVPPSIRDAALGIGASQIQTTFHHVLPLAMPGILTGTIIGMAQALGETAPLLMIGMVAFIADVPQSITDPAAALPVQIYLWADSPERGFSYKTSAAIVVLLTFLILMNAAAVMLRKKFERRW
ncbi:MAG: phosphate ABC transporter permease PstA [Gammaproteobacteria bacterium]|nr:phosphate ABC transporter permease PstA [Gammaproteobacteria bacterium]